MRRHDREITDSREILSIVNECKVIRLAMLDEQGLPYIIPLNFGYRFADGVFTFYCHSAREGRKLELLRRDPRVSFEMDCRGELQSADHACGYGYYYASVIGSGTAELIEGAEKLGIPCYDAEIIQEMRSPRSCATWQAVRIPLRKNRRAVWRFSPSGSGR